MKLVTVGSVALDSVRTPHGSVQRELGGSAVHASVAASYHAPSLGLVGVVGHDFPDRHVKMLQKRAVHTGGLERVKGRTFHWKGRYEGDMAVAHTLNTELGVFADFDPQIPMEYRKAPFVFLANVTPEIQLKVLKQMKQPRFALLDTMNFWIASKKAALKKVLRHVTAAVLNDQEIRQLTGEHSLVLAAKATMKLGPKFILLKRGEHGATVIGKNLHFHLPAFPTEKVKDPTGAGDSFAGGFMGSLAKAGSVTPANLRQAMAVGTVMASFNVEDFSVKRTRRLSRPEINRRLSALKAMIRI